ncbi:MAG: DUF2628 domain-containing protein [Rhizobiaceae bacterium]
MASYVVMQPQGGRDAVEEAVLVRDGFHLFAFIFPFLWLFFHRLWLEGLIVLLAAILIGIGSSTFFASNAGALLSILVSIFVGLEGSAMRVAALRRRGWREWGVVEADNPADAELRYMAALAEEVDETPPPPRPWGRSPSSRAESGSDTTALGMLGYSGGRR